MVKYITNWTHEEEWMWCVYPLYPAGITTIRASCIRPKGKDLLTSSTSANWYLWITLDTRLATCRPARSEGDSHSSFYWFTPSPAPHVFLRTVWAGAANDVMQEQTADWSKYRNRSYLEEWLAGKILLIIMLATGWWQSMLLWNNATAKQNLISFRCLFCI